MNLWKNARRDKVWFLTAMISLLFATVASLGLADDDSDSDSDSDIDGDWSWVKDTFWYVTEEDLPAVVTNQKGAVSAGNRPPTTGHAGPHQAIREVEVMRVGAHRDDQSKQWA